MSATTRVAGVTAWTIRSTIWSAVIAFDLLVKRDLADPRPGSLRGQADRLVGHIVVLLGREDLLIGRKPQAVVDEAHPHGGAVGQGDVGGVDAQVLPGCGACRLL